MIVILDEYNRADVSSSVSEGEKVATLVWPRAVTQVSAVDSDAVLMVGLGIHQVQSVDHSVMTISGWKSYKTLRDEAKYYEEMGSVIWVYVKCAVRVLMFDPVAMRIPRSVWSCATTPLGAAAEVRAGEYMIDGCDTYWEYALRLCCLTFVGVQRVARLSVAVVGHYITQGGVVNRGVV